MTARRIVALVASAVLIYGIGCLMVGVAGFVGVYDHGALYGVATLVLITLYLSAPGDPAGPEGCPVNPLRLLVISSAITSFALAGPLTVLLYALLLGETDTSALAGYAVLTGLAVLLTAPVVIRVALRWVGGAR